MGFGPSFPFSAVCYVRTEAYRCVLRGGVKRTTKRGRLIRVGPSVAHILPSGCVHSLSAFADLCFFPLFSTVAPVLSIFLERSLDRFCQDGTGVGEAVVHRAK